ncbi:hypothetical protein AB0L00_26025 [Actinoallomurus sp. NPDC052308]|uniref:hypothetical protein n=1 Tax=Actinoallomurus sp. NPDC052308 TaxID=3155530 RepID=UPI003413510C
MPYYRARRLGCGGVLVGAGFVALMGIVALICIANRSWFEGKVTNAIYGDRRAIHLGKEFKPGATAEEDGVRQTAVLIDRAPHVRVTSPPDKWLKNHKDAVCKHDVCTAAATPLKSVGGVGIGLGGLAAMGVVVYAVYSLLFDDGMFKYGGFGGGYGGGYGGGRYMR